MEKDAMDELDKPLLASEEELLAAEAGEQRGWADRARLWLRADHSDNPLVHTTPFIMGQELGERLCYYGIATNLVVYLRNRLGYSGPDASAAATSWSGSCYLTAIIGAVVADRWLGRFRTIVLFSFFYQAGMVLLCFSPAVFTPATGPDGKALSAPAGADKAVFWAALYLIALGTGGIKPNVSTFGADQFTAGDARHDQLKLSYWSFLYVMVNLGSLVATTFLVAIQEAHHWTLGFAIPTVALAFSIASFTSGKPRYRPELAKGAARVVGGARAWYAEHKGKLARVGHALPFVVCNGIFWSVYMQMSSTYIVQGEQMDRRVFGQKVPAASMNTIDIVVVLLFIPICDRSLYPRLVARGIATTPARRMAAGYAFACVAMFAAAGCERARLHAARTLPLLSAEPDAAADALRAARYSLMWQTPQYFLTGLAEVLEAVAEADFFYSIAPVELRSIFMALRLVATALGGYFASFEIQIAQRTTSWMADDLNAGRLDLFYASLGVLQTLNTAVFVALAYYSPATNAPPLPPLSEPAEAP